MSPPQEPEPSYRWQLRLVILITVLIIVAFLAFIYGMIKTAQQL